MGNRREERVSSPAPGKAIEEPHSLLTEPTGPHLPQAGFGLNRATLCRDASPAKMSSPVARDLGGGGRTAWRREEGAQHKQPLVWLTGVVEEGFHIQRRQPRAFLLVLGVQQCGHMEGGRRGRPL